MENNKDNKYKILLIILEIMLGAILIFFGIIVWPMSVLLLLIGLLLLFIGIIDILKLVAFRVNSRIVGEHHE